jgi:hypothetical protein
MASPVTVRGEAGRPGKDQWPDDMILKTFNHSCSAKNQIAKGKYGVGRSVRSKCNRPCSGSVRHGEVVNNSQT